MSFAKYAQFYKDNGFFAGSKIKTTITDTSFIGTELVLSKGNKVIRSTTIPASGAVEFFTDESGILTLSANNGNSTISGTVEVGAYATYNVNMSGVVSDRNRQIFATKNEIEFDNETTSDTVTISYTGDISNVSVSSSNTNVATATVDKNVVTVSDAGKGLKGTSDVTVTVAQTDEYNAKSVTIHVTKDNGRIDKSWYGLKNIVESGLESEMCEVGEEYPVTLSNGKTIIFIIGAIDHDYDHQIIFVPKRYDYLDVILYANNWVNRYENSSICNYLNGAFFEMLPIDLRGVISPKTVQYAISLTELVSYTKKIWLPREYEILGTTEEAYVKEREIYRIGRFPCFTNNLVELFESNSASYYNENVIPTSSPEAEDSNDVVCAYRYKNNTYNRYQTYDKSAKSTFRPFPCFHIIKET
jgi:hypothetical protein